MPSTTDIPLPSRIGADWISNHTFVEEGTLRLMQTNHHNCTHAITKKDRVACRKQLDAIAAQYAANLDIPYGGRI